MLREHRLLVALADTDVPHPRVIAGCDDPSVVGGCFYLMEFVDGWSPIQEGTTWPAPFGSDLDARRGLAFELVDGIARLARVDWEARGLEGFGKPDGFHERQVDRWLHHLEAVQFRPLPGIDEAAAWLRTHRPRTYVPGSCTATISSPTSCTATARRPGSPPSSTGRWPPSATRCSTSGGSSTGGPTTPRRAARAP